MGKLTALGLPLLLMVVILGGCSAGGKNLNTLKDKSVKVNSLSESKTTNEIQSITSSNLTLERLMFSDLSYCNVGNTERTVKDFLTNYNSNEQIGTLCDVESLKKDWMLRQLASQKLGVWDIIGDYHGTGLGEAFYGTAFKNEKTKEIVIAFRGTENLEDGIYDALSIATKISDAVVMQVAPAEYFTATVIGKYKNKGYKVSFTGHSLGGYLAQKVMLDIEENKLFGNDEKLTNEIKKMVTFEGSETFNAPGYSDLVAQLIPTLKLFKPNEQYYVTDEQLKKSKNGAYKSVMMDYIINLDAIGNTGTQLGSYKKYPAAFQINKFLKNHSLSNFYQYFCKYCIVPPSYAMDTTKKYIYNSNGTLKTYTYKGKLTSNDASELEIDKKMVGYNWWVDNLQTENLLENETMKGLNFYDSLEIPYPIKIGEKWTYNFSEDGSGPSTMEIVSTNNTVTTTAGTFENVIKVRVNNSENYRYYAKDVGLILIEYNGTKPYQLVKLQ